MQMTGGGPSSEILNSPIIAKMQSFKRKLLTDVIFKILLYYRRLIFLLTIRICLEYTYSHGYR
jgi:hypothetical protein